MDTDLVRRAQGGDQEAFADLVYAIADRFLAVSHRILSDIDLAEDATQQALLSVWQDLPQLRDPARFEAWSYRLLVRACYAEGRKSRRWAPNLRLLSVDEPMAVDGLSAVVDRDQLERAFRRLSMNHRTVVVLHHYLDLPLDRVADIVGAPVGTVGSRLHYATGKLRSALDGRCAADGPGGGAMTDFKPPTGTSTAPSGRGSTRTGTRTSPASRGRCWTRWKRPHSAAPRGGRRGGSNHEQARKVRARGRGRGRGARRRRPSSSVPPLLTGSAELPQLRPSASPSPSPIGSMVEYQMDGGAADHGSHRRGRWKRTCPARPSQRSAQAPTPSSWSVPPSWRYLGPRRHDRADHGPRREGRRLVGGHRQGRLAPADRDRVLRRQVGGDRLRWLARKISQPGILRPSVPWSPGHWCPRLISRPEWDLPVDLEHPARGRPSGAAHVASAPAPR